MRYDPNKYEEKYLNWKKSKKLKDISKKNSKILIEFLTDMEQGYNVGRAGNRSYSRLLNLKQRMRWMMSLMEIHYKKDCVIDFFNIKMRKGKIKNRYGKPYSSIPDYANVFKSFWHWYQKREDDKDNVVKDLTRFIDISPMKTNTFVYLTIDDVKKIANASKFYYKTLMWFMFDSGIRSPTELMNVRCSDLEQMKDSNNFELNIRDEVSKTFGRRIKLLICSDLLKEFIATNELKNQDYLFTKHPRTTNKYIKRIAEKVLGDKMTKAGEGIKSISLYDFRHASACYWLPRYKSESALKYRFGWKRGEMIHRYTKLLGMKDTIQESDMLLQSEAKTKLEKEIEIMKTQNEIMQDKLKQMEEMLTKTRIPLTEKIIKKNISRLTKEEKNELGL